VVIAVDMWSTRFLRCPHIHSLHWLFLAVEPELLSPQVLANR